MVRQNAGEAMYEKVKERRLIDTLLKICEEVRRENGKIDTHKWSTNGLMRDLGQVMIEKGEPEYPGN